MKATQHNAAIKTKASAKLSTLSMESLILAWNATSGMKMTAEVTTTRGWIMDELERRDSSAFEMWMDGNPHNGPECYFSI